MADDAVPKTFTNLGQSVPDIFAGFAAETSASLTAQGLRIQAYGTLTDTQMRAAGMEISAAGINTQAQGLRIKAAGDIAEGQEYDLAAALARKNDDYVKESAAIQSLQLDREISGTMGTARATAAASGLKESGSVVDILADSAAQGALAQSVLEKQTAISTAGYEEQAQSYDVMSAAARMAAGGETSIADATDAIAGQTRALGAQTAAVGATVAGQQMSLAQQTEEAGKSAATGDFIGAALKGAAAIAGFALGPATGGLSRVAAGAVEGAEGAATGSPAGLPTQA
jgi:hypothetical protein